MSHISNNYLVIHENLKYATIIGCGDLGRSKDYHLSGCWVFFFLFLQILCRSFFIGVCFFFYKILQCKLLCAIFGCFISSLFALIFIYQAIKLIPHQSYTIHSECNDTHDMCLLLFIHLYPSVDLCSLTWHLASFWNGIYDCILNVYMYS